MESNRTLQMGSEQREDGSLAMYTSGFLDGIHDARNTLVQFLDRKMMELGDDHLTRNELMLVLRAYADGFK
jgi:hypothetical protein